MQRLLEEGGEGEPLDRVHEKPHDFPEERAAADLTADGRELPELSASDSERKRQEIGVNRGAWKARLRRVSVLSQDKANAVKVSFVSGQMTLFSSNPDFGEATEELAAQYEGEALNTGFNARYCWMSSA